MTLAVIGIEREDTRSRTAGEHGAPSPWSGIAALLLHAAAVAALALMPDVPILPPIPEQAIEVEIVTEPAPDKPAPPSSPGPALTDRPPAPAPPKPPPSPAPAQAPPATAQAMVTPSRMLSATALAEPRNRPVRRSLALLAPEERAEQLCTMEALAQLAAWNPALRPEQIVAYAMAEVKRTAAGLLAEGAAFRSRGQWLGLRFRCDLTADRAAVAAFAFAVGEPIPQGAWAGHGLTAGGGPLD